MKGLFSEFDIFRRRALSSPPTPYQVLPLSEHRSCPENVILWCLGASVNAVPFVVESF